MMTNRVLQWMAFSTWVLFAANPAWSASKITAIDFQGKKAPQALVIKGDAPLQVTQQANAQDKQIVLEVADAEFASKALTQKLDTSSFAGPVSMVSPYAVPGQKGVRIVLQLRSDASAEISQEGNSTTVTIGGGAEASNEKPSAGAEGEASQVADGSQSGSADPKAQDQEKGQEMGADAPPEQPVVAASDSKGKDLENTEESKQIDDFLESSLKRKYVGRPITLQVRNVDVLDIFNLISEASGFNIILSPSVGGKLTMSLVDVPWDLALDTVFQSLKLGGRRNGNVLRVAPLGELASEERAQQEAKSAALLNAPRVTKIFSVSYAEPSALAGMITAFSTASNAATAGAPPTFVQVDARTNSIVVQDTSDKIQKIQKLIELLDTQTPQVLVEAKVVEVSERFTKSTGGSIGLSSDVSSTTGTQFFGTFAGVNPVDPLVGSPGVFASGSAIAGNNGALFGMSPRVSFLPGVNRLNALLSMGESEGMVKIVASPRTVVSNKMSSTITQGVPVEIRTQSTQNGAPVGVSNVQQANLSLTVTPTVTNDGSVSMQLQLDRNSPSGVGIANRSLTTNVLVESGVTLVIGGVYTSDQDRSSSGFPLLRKLPIIGALFGTDAENSSRSELIMFITPRILNQKESGLSG